MPITESPVIALRRLVVECDRCQRSKTVEVADGAPDVDPVGSLGWQSVRHPQGGGLLVFDTRSCMSAWYATFVRTLYGGPAELPKRRSPQKKAKAEK